IGGFPDGEKTKFVEVNPEHAKDRQVYDDAVRNICREETHCSVAFFLRGDPAPLNQTSAFFYRSLGSGAGGWQNPEYHTLAFWRQNRISGLAEYVSWDCDRAAAENAPLQALCGRGVSEAYGALLSL